MANVDAPRGLIPVKNAGKVLRTTEYTKTAASEVFEGDLIKRVAAGTIESHDAADTDPIVGVAAHHSAAADTVMAIYDDPETIFKAQTADAYALADNGLNVDISDAGGSSTTLLSGYEIDMSTKATTATLPLKILRLAPAVNQEDNIVGSNATIFVKVNRHEQGNLQTGI